jgi:hypothetical protein
MTSFSSEETRRLVTQPPECGVMAITCRYHRCIPDFSFETPWGDRIIWEHLGMLVVPEYKASWERKLKFYEEIGYTLGENLFTTCDHENGAIMHLNYFVKEYFLILNYLIFYIQLTKIHCTG